MWCPALNEPELRARERLRVEGGERESDEVCRSAVDGPCQISEQSGEESKSKE